MKFYIESHIDPYVVAAQAPLGEVAHKLSLNASKTLFVLGQDNVLVGSVTDGDIRRGLASSGGSVLCAADICNRTCFRVSNLGRNNVIETGYDLGVSVIPVVVDHRLVSVGTLAKEGQLSISGRGIGKGFPCFLIAEVGNNHNGEFENAIRLVDAAQSAGADAVKFQIRTMTSLYRSGKNHKAIEDLGVEYVRDLLEKFELNRELHERIYEYVNSQTDLFYMCTPWDLDSLAFLEGWDLDLYKVASADLTNDVLLEAIAKTKKPMIVSTGMSYSAEIDHAVNLLNSLSAEFALLHTNSAYPAPISDINLLYLKILQEKHPLVGYSGHERGFVPTLGAVALGAKIVERHITLSRDMEGPDHAASLEPDSFTEMVSMVREMESSLGEDSPFRVVSQGELINRESLAKSLVAARDLSTGDIVKEEDLLVRSPGQGLSPQKKRKLVGVQLARNIEKGEFFYESDLDEKPSVVRNFRYNRPWGVPVRFHDMNALVAVSNPDLVEFHLSYADLERDPHDFNLNVTNLDFVVHAPELFAGSHLLDLCAVDEDYRSESVENLAKTISVAEKLRSIFNKTTKVKIVANVGGFSRDQFAPLKDINLRKSQFEKSLTELNMSSIELLPQNMAPFPWHFGGQRYQNFLLHPDQIVDVCADFELNVCLDVSHAALYCNAMGYDINKYIELVGPFASHLHISDSSGSNGEGLQFGEGGIEFSELCQSLNTYCPRVSFIPEVWQGHKNNGEGFWRALDYLIKYFN